MGEIRQRNNPLKKNEIASKLKEKKNISEKSNFLKYLKMAGIATLVVTALGFFWNKYESSLPVTVAKVDDSVEYFKEVKCSDEHAKKKYVSKCTPKKCGRLVLDGLFNQEEIDVLIKLASEGTMCLGGGEGGASILELSSSSCSRGSGFVSLFQMLKNGQEVEKIKSIYSEENLSVYYSAKEKVKMAIATAFGLDEDLLHLTQPTFFSRLTGQKAKSAHDEYWHSHIDSNQYPHFDYTALVYLNNHSHDFDGGRFIFESSSIGGDEFVEPKSGRIGVFTSGAENPHRVEQVLSGERFAFTLGFTCNPDQKIPDPSLPL